MLETVIAITPFLTGVSGHFRSLKHQVLKIALCVTYWQAGVISAILRLRVQPGGFLTIQTFVSKVPPFNTWEMAGKPRGSLDADWISGESGDAIVLWAASGGTRGKVVSLVASRGNCVWQQSLLTHRTQVSVVTNDKTHLVSWQLIFHAWYHDTTAAHPAQLTFFADAVRSHAYIMKTFYHYITVRVSQSLE